MKPHLRFKWGVWSCSSLCSDRGWVIGLGYTVRDAWDDWKRYVVV